MKRARSFLLLLLGLIAVLCSLTAWTVYREHRQERLNRDLIAAVKRNDTKAVVSLLDQGADANSHDEPYMPVPWWKLLRDRIRGVKPKTSTALTPLLLALQWKFVAKGRISYPPQNLTLVKALLDHKAHINSTDQAGRTPLFLAIMDRQSPTIHLLLAYGADVKPGSQLMPLLSYTLLYLPDGMDILTDMLQRGANVNEGVGIGSTTIGAAIFLQNVKAVRLLLSYHADVTIRDMDLGGETLLAMAKSELVEAHSQENPYGYDPVKIQQIIHLLKQAGAKE